jgi:hypothetical protein
LPKIRSNLTKKSGKKGLGGRKKDMNKVAHIPKGRGDPGSMPGMREKGDGMTEKLLYL